MQLNYLASIQTQNRNKIAGLHPIAKFIICFFLIAITLVLETFKLTSLNLPLLLIPNFLLILLLIGGSGIFKKCYAQIKAILSLSLFILIVQSLSLQGGFLLFHFYFLHLYSTGVQNGFFLGLLILNIASEFIWFLNTTTIDEMTVSLESVGLNYRAIFVLSSTMRMVSTLTKRSKEIFQVQSARGINSTGKISIKFLSFSSAIIPLIVGAIMEAEERSLALEARGFSLKGPRTTLVTIRPNGYESISLAFVIILLGFILIGRALI
ncbi:energy-coupling factor transporter transmembrane component T [Levilactobacillus huananensis]|uniref:energy-coupling factor transporter transmembrane component T n=1 Tax=Levilactobacillus huananensis TaxID=2486019 RepID=UPI0013DDD5AC|nr:energy-coupling factor transporter transmembrane component T [Levilactobacillus huananensis]